MADYCTLDEIKSELTNITTKDYDGFLQAMIGQAKELIDNLCNREFDKVTATARYFDGAGTILFIDDLVSIDASGFQLDLDGDGTYESTLATTDYELYPLNTTPKTFIKISSNSNYGSFASGIKKGVKITGTWGYGSTIPKSIRRAAIMQVCRWFKRRETGYATVVGSPELGEVKTYHGLDPDVKLILKPYIRKNL